MPVKDLRPDLPDTVPSTSSRPMLSMARATESEWPEKVRTTNTDSFQSTET